MGGGTTGDGDSESFVISDLRLVIAMQLAHVVQSPEELRQRTKQFALRIIRLFRALPETDEARILGRQLLRSGTGTAANYRSACRARSIADFISKIGIALEEADETVFWMELLIDAEILAENRLKDLMAEANELVKIFAATRSTARKRKPDTVRKRAAGQQSQITNQKSEIAVSQSQITNRRSPMPSQIANHKSQIIEGAHA